VRAYFSGKPSRTVRGRIAADTDSTLVDFLLEQGEAKPLRGITISTNAAGRLVSAVSDAAGRYNLRLPAAGTFRVRAALAPYTPTSATVSVQGRGCADQNFGLSIDNTISGTVVDRQGQPVKSARVGLIDLDQPHSPRDRHVWFEHAYMEQNDQTFLFKNVPIGRYRLVFNPDGPGKGSLFDLALESTSFPGVIEINNSGTHLKGINLTAGPLVEMRQITVRARFSDGSAMRTAYIRCLGDPLRPGEFLWVGSPVPGKLTPGEAQFYTPVNRRLTIQLTDSYGRDLGGTYSATHGPGVTPIRQEFVVKL
jgi:hypothetical protein